MPIYEYHCEECERDFEQFLRSMASKEAIVCPTCGSEQVKKAMSVFGGVSHGGGVSSYSNAAPACAPSG
jgi:putative FmdB family regulatory protein